MNNFEYQGIPLAGVNLWVNPDLSLSPESHPVASINSTDVEEASARLQRFAPLLMHLFPDLAPDQGLIESALLAVRPPVQVPDGVGRFWVKADHDLPVAGSIKARGGIHEVLQFVESVALEQGLWSPGQSTTVLASDAARSVLGQYRVAVGSTGNLGMSIGLISAALGLRAEVHMSSEAKAWKKKRLRDHGVTVFEYDGDYALAVQAGRQEALKDPHTHFVDDEKSPSLFAGYAVAAERLQRQFQEQGVVVDALHPLFVYLPCGVGGAPGGVCYGLKQVFGPDVHCFFIEPDQSACFDVQMRHSDQPGISIYQAGQTNSTEADGLAVPVASQLAIEAMRPRLSGTITVPDAYLLADLFALHQHEALKVEPSAAAVCSGPRALFNTVPGRQYLAQHGLDSLLPQANHVLWTTGGRFVPPDEYHGFLVRGQQAAHTLFGAV